MLVYYWLFMVFVIGAMFGSFLNVVIARVPLEKSLIWPGSRCGACFQPIRWFDNLPIISYLWLRGRCRVCGQSFSPRYLFVELLTALGFSGLFYAELVVNIHDWPIRGGMPALGFFPESWWLGFGYHALLYSFLVAISVCDLDRREIPLSITVTGTLVGLFGATLLPWPWPNLPVEAQAPPFPGADPAMAWVIPGSIKEGIYAWPVWGPLPAWLAPGGNWQTGLATGLAGALVGAFLLRGVGFLVGTGLRKEALGLGDADLMMMAGAFLGWQIAVVALFVSVVPALFFALFNAVVRKDSSLPFGPSLSAGVMLTSLGWRWLGPYVQSLFFWGQMLAILVGVGAALMLGVSFLLRILRPTAKS